MIVGTAGHVDHGKTTLVRLLTGVDTDRLKEEKARGITTDLGFAYMPGPGGEIIGFIDVPGHESLVRTMVAGAAGIDYALLVVGADEGVKPQTREHLEILRLLGIGRGLVAVTKADRAEPERRAVVLREIGALVEGTVLASHAPLFVSATSGEGMTALRGRLEDAAREGRRATGAGHFRMAVDRSFTLKGVGTVVAGTATSGRVAVDDIVTIMPGGGRARVRSLHVQNEPAQVGKAGDRCALALVGVARDAVPRGAWICDEPEPMENARLDIELHVSASEAKALGQSVPVHVHAGASDLLGRVSALSTDALAPGRTGVARLTLSTPLPLCHGDRLVLRDMSARRTIGGGRVIDPRPPLRHRRAPERLARLAALAEADHATALRRLLDEAPGVEDLTAFAVDRGLTTDQTDVLAGSLDLQVFGSPTARFAARPVQLVRLSDALLARLGAVHADQPELPGLALERLRQSVEPVLPKPAFAALVQRLLSDGRIAQRGPWLHLPEHVAQLSAEDRRIAELILPLIEKERFRPPRVRDVGAAILFHETQVRHACKALVRTGALIEIANDHFFTRDTVVEMAAIACRLTDEGEDGRFSAADFRDRLDNGRKVAIQILEYFDRHGLTHRSGDRRRVVKMPEAVFGAVLPGAEGRA